MRETIFLALMGTAFGVLLSVPLSFLAARNLMKGSAAGNFVYLLVRTFFNLTRSVEVMIVAVIMAVVGVLACAAPARRALRVQPTEALRQS